MGNRKSSSFTAPSAPKLTKQISAKRRTTPSPTPSRSGSLVPTQSARRLSSFRHNEEFDTAIATIDKNRSRSFRESSGQPRYISSGRRHSNVCETTGLSTHHKAILTNTWRQLPRSLVFDLGKRVFMTIFEHEPSLLVVINLEHLQHTDQWREHVNFRMHAQRFTHSLSQCMRNLCEPIVAADRLQEFGASYANRKDIEYGGANAYIPHSYWDHLTSAITTTANHFLEKHLEKPTRNLLTVNDAFENSNSVLEESLEVNAWAMLATFVSNQIRFGYEMERMLKAELKKLSLDNRQPQHQQQQQQQQQQRRPTFH